jgi:molybdate transport system substrate-binding protein
MKRRKVLKLVAAGWPVLASGAVESAQEDRPVLVAVAASVQRAMEELARSWTESSGGRLDVVYGSSGNFVRQIQQGLPAELFLSADESFALKLVGAGLTQGEGVIYATGRVALLLAKGSAIALDPRLRGLKDAWGRIEKFAIANPELAPYGQAAREVLQTVGLWDRAQSKLVMGENIGQATQFVVTGSAQAGITALSLLIGNAAPGLGPYLALPDSLHAPLRQRMVLLRTARPQASAFYQYLQTAPARAVLQRHGFAVPAEK